MTGPRPAGDDDVPVAVPYRITQALDVRALYGPEVDEACGVREPAVDRWEAGTERPTLDQLRRLATLTGFPVEFFTRPLQPGEVGPVFVCTRGVSGSQVVTAPKPVLAPLPDAPFTQEGLW